MILGGETTTTTSNDQAGAGLFDLKNLVVNNEPTNNGVPPAPPQNQATEQKIDTPPETGGDDKKPEAQQQANNTAATENTSNTPTDTPAGDHPIEINDQDLGHLLSDATKGAIGSVQDMMALVEENNRLRKLYENPAELFQDPEQRKIYEFMSKFRGSDYGASLQTYAHLHNLDIPKLSAEEALREDFVMEQSKFGIPRNKAEQMFQLEFEEKYSSKGELADAYLQRDSFEAKKRLDAARNEFTAEKVDAQQAEQQQRIQQAQENYTRSAEETLNGYKSLSLVGLTDNPENDFHFEVEDTRSVEEAMFNYQGFFNSRYVNEGTVNTELLAMDLTRLIHQEKIDKMLFDHGTTVGREMEIAKRNNIPPKGETPASNIGNQGGVPGSFMEALLGGSVVKK